MRKQELGQFFTTNSAYILQGFEHTVLGKDVLDPFAGGGDLLRWADAQGCASVEGLDIDPKLSNEFTAENDSLKAIPITQFILTNPPYLAKNKMSAEQKKIYPMPEHEDLYLLAIDRIIESGVEEGIIIVPVNFFSAENSDKVRVRFLSTYLVERINYFRNQVFEDTTYNVVAFHFAKASTDTSLQSVEFHYFPGDEVKTFVLEREFNFRIAGRELHPIQTVKPLKTIRLTSAWMKHREHGHKIVGFFNDKDEKGVMTYHVASEQAEQIKNNIVMLNCIDTNASVDGWIKAEDVRCYNKDCLVGKNSSRNIAYVLLPDISLHMQELIIPLFNKKLNNLRREFDSLFLTNFRDNDRKRVSFDFCYKLIAHCYYELKNPQDSL
jgi:hypothetical protein